MDGAKVCSVCGTPSRTKMSKKSVIVIVIFIVLLLVAGAGFVYSLSYTKQAERFMDALLTLDMDKIERFYPSEMLENTQEDRDMIKDRLMRYRERYADSIEMTYEIGEFNLLETNDAEYALSLFFNYDCQLMSAYTVTNTVHMSGDEFGSVDIEVDLLVFFKGFKWYVILY